MIESAPLCPASIILLMVDRCAGPVVSSFRSHGVSECLPLFFCSEII